MTNPEGVQKLQKPPINLFGCYLLCLFEYAGVKFDPAKYDEYVSKGYIGDECFIKEPVAILRDLGVDVVRVQRVIASPTSGKYVIENVRPGFTHFTLWDGERKWDPLPPDRPGAEYYLPASYRVFS